MFALSKTNYMKNNMQHYQTLGLTALEIAVMDSLISQLYAEEGFSDVDANDISKDIDVPTVSVRGAVGSLVKKGLIWTERTDTFGAEKQYTLIYLSEAFYHLHPKWGASEVPVQIFQIIEKEPKNEFTTNREFILILADDEGTLNPYGYAIKMFKSLRAGVITERQFELIAGELRLHCMRYKILTDNEIVSLF